MPKYVNVDEILNKLPDDLPYKASVKRVLIQAPEADVVPKREGEWVHGENEMAHCSECGNEEPSHSISPYCPECGARMEDDAE